MLPTRQYQSITRPIIVIGLFIGLLLSWSLLSGDSQGRVNILYLIGVYVVLPIASIIISLLSLLFKLNFNLAGLLSQLPLWTQFNKVSLLKQKQHPDSRLLFFYQSQLAAISFSAASLVVFFLLLLSTDINFVWRSTLLNADQIYPLLQTIAMPWQFIEAAQPDLALLQSTQDSRMRGAQGSTSVFGNWWPFILATQVCYAFLLRGLLLAAAASALKIRENRRNQGVSLGRQRATSGANGTHEFPPMATDIPGEYALNNWAAVDESLLAAIQSPLTGRAIHSLVAGPLASEVEQGDAEQWRQPQLLIVKGWEPPLGELADFMASGKGYLMPLDWNDTGIQPLSPVHTSEWRRFLLGLPQWQLILPGNHQGSGFKDPVEGAG